MLGAHCRDDVRGASRQRDNSPCFFNCDGMQKKAAPEERLAVQSERLGRPESTSHQLKTSVQESNAQMGLETTVSAGTSSATDMTR
jgi:hypothetical protein